MALSFSTSKPPRSTSYSYQTLQPGSFRNPTRHVRCESLSPDSCDSSSPDSGSPAKRSRLEIGSPIIVIEAPKMVKTAASVPCLRVNTGLVKPGDVGRIISRKPKDVWAIRLAIGTYLLDGKYFKPLEFDE